MSAWPNLRARLRIWALAGLCLLGVGCATAPMVHAPVVDVPRELEKRTLPPYVIEPPDVLIIEAFLPPSNKDPEGPAQPLSPQPVSGTHLVRPDGTVGLGIYGSVQLAGLTLDEARDSIRRYLIEAAPYGSAKGIAPEKLLVIVDVAAFNSKSYYVITDGAGYGEQVYPFPVTGSETVLDAVSKINGLPAVASKRNIWVARR